MTRWIIDETVHDERADCDDEVLMVGVLPFMPTKCGVSSKGVGARSYLTPKDPFRIDDFRIPILRPLRLQFANNTHEVDI